TDFYTLSLHDALPILMDLTENLYRTVAQKVLGTTTVTYKGVELELGKPFERITMVDAVKKYAGIDISTEKTDEEAKAIADAHHIDRKSTRLNSSHVSI